MVSNTKKSTSVADFSNHAWFRCTSQIGMLIALGVSFILALTIAILSSKHVAVEGFIRFVTLCQLVMSLNVKLKHVFWCQHSHSIFAEIWGC
jgi:hypothetical protein